MFAQPLPARPSLEYYRKLAKDRRTEKACKLSEAQFSIARDFGFANWPEFSAHLKAIARPDSPQARFEAAADAIADGDIEILKHLLAQDPSLVRHRSARKHRSTLLHYVSANGVEDFRQRTPNNIVTIAALLLDAGADVNAQSDAYGGGSTALNLTATSGHPERAGVQIALLQLFIDRGARISLSDVRACLHNGRGSAAAFLAERVAALDLECAAGVGRLDLVRHLCETEVHPQQLRDGFCWACEYGHFEVVKFLFDQGVDHMQGDVTGLHWAALGAHVEIVEFLLRGGANPDAVEKRFGGTPAGWARHRFAETSDAAERQRLSEITVLLEQRKLPQT